MTPHNEKSPAPAPADERAAFESLKGAWQSMPPFDVFCAGWRAARAASANETGAEGAELVAQWQSRLKDRSSPVVDRWVNISPDGAKTLMEKYANVYEVRALYAAPQPPAQADAREPKIDAQPEGGEIAESLVPQGEVARSGGAREGLTDEQREAIERAVACLELSELSAERAISDDLRALLAAHPGQPEPADCGETLPGEYTNADDLIASLREPEPRAEVTDEQIADMFERVTGYSIENGRAALNDADILGFARELLEAARAGDAS